MSALSWDTANHLTVPRLRSGLPGRAAIRARTLPNGQRISGERGGEGDERVRCMCVLGAAANPLGVAFNSHHRESPKPA
jgi:hypothetical protein